MFAMSVLQALGQATKCCRRNWISYVREVEDEVIQNKLRDMVA
jgi:DNA-directed RNA polymerase subunit N (RpoN/RPB10)